MAIVVVPGGQVELRDKPNVGGRERLVAANVDVIDVVRTRLPQGYEINVVSDLAKLPPGAVDSKLVTAFSALNKAGIVAFVKSWSFQLPLPTMDNIDDMDTDLYDALSKHLAPLLAQAIMGEKFGPEGHNDPDSPTEPRPT